MSRLHCFTSFEDSEKKKELAITNFITNLFPTVWEYAFGVDVTFGVNMNELENISPTLGFPYDPIFGGRRCQEGFPSPPTYATGDDLRRVKRSKKTYEKNHQWLFLVPLKGGR